MGARNWLFVGIFIATVTLVAIVVNNFRVINAGELSRLQAAVDRAESLDLAIYADHLRQNSVPDEENAFIEYLAIQKLIDEEEWWQKEIVFPSQLANVEDPVDLDAVTRKMVLEWQPALELARAGAKKPKFYASREWEQGPMLLSQDAYKMGDVCLVLIEQAKIRFDDGDSEASLESLETVLDVIGHYKSEGQDLIVFSMSMREVNVAKEIVRQAQTSTSVDHLNELGKLLADMFEPVPPKGLARNQIVEYVEFIRLVSEDSEYGDTFREQMKEMQVTNAVAEVFGTTLPADEAREFEIRAINAACDFYESVSDSLEDYEQNEKLFKEMIVTPFDWSTDGFPLGFLRPYEVYNGTDVETATYTYKRHAKHVVFGDMYRSAFDHITKKHELSDGDSWQAASLKLAELTFSKIESGFEISIDMPGYDKRSYKFENTKFKNAM